MRGLRSTLVLLVVFVGLAGYIYFVERTRPATSDIPTKEKLFAVDSAKIQEIRIKAASGETSVLRRSGDKWQMVEPAATAADDTELSSITSNLASLEIQRVVEEAPTDLTPYGLAAPRIEVAFKAEGDKDFRRLLIGEKTATGGDLYAKLATDKKVFLIAGYLEGTFNRTPFDLRDKAVLHFDRDKIDIVEVRTASHTVKLAKSEGNWVLVEPWRARADYGFVEGLIGRLSTTQMKAIAAQEASDLGRYGLAKPEVVATVGAGSTRATLEIGRKGDDGTYYARDASRPLVFTIEALLVDDLKKGPADYRRKDLFDYRAFNATRFEVTRAGQTLVFEKTKTSDKDPEPVWRQVAPTKADIDRTKFEDALSKFSYLRAEAWVDSRANTGLNAPELAVAVRYEEGKKQERVEFGRSGGTVYAAPAGEPGAARLSSKEFDDAVAALEAAIKPVSQQTDKSAAPSQTPTKK
jgi:hypothetical protein